MILITNVKVFGNPDADSILIDNDRIAEVGTEDYLRIKAGGSISEVIDGGGGLVLPGLIDSHIHLYSSFVSKHTVNLRNVRSIEELKDRLRRFVRKAKPKTFIIGFGWDHELFREKRLPTSSDIDEVVRDVPVMLTRICGHIAVVNSKLIKLLNLENLVKKYHGLIEVDDYGRPTGVVKESIIDYIKNNMPKPPIHEVKEGMLKFMKELISYGITSVHAVSVDAFELSVLSNLASEGILPLRVRVYVSPNAVDKALTIPSSGFFKVNGVKLFADGSLGGRTAFLREEYNDYKGRGSLLLDTEVFAKLSREVLRRGWQLAVHAIGDGALEYVLELALKLRIYGPNLRIEHASLTPPDIIELMKSVKPLISVQPHFTVSDWWVGERLGRRAKYVYAYRSLMDAGLTLGGGSDSPVEPYNPWLSISAAMTRGSIRHINPHESLSLHESIYLYTKGSATLGLDSDLGELRKGAKADLVLVSEYLESMYGYDISSVRPSMVIINGKVVYKREF